ncbi:hypothetical protein HZ326_23016 [Fusarium oxysporum f. sp. albedinis]|nr:hypothetical protein HZ326_23016 [Fusarium oxysporum f. sp. albedinis]
MGLRKRAQGHRQAAACKGKSLWFNTVINSCTKLRYGNTNIKQALYGYAEKRSIAVCQNDESTAMSLISHEETSSRCDVCTLTIPENEVIYKCRVCYGGDFDICSDCYMIGGRCLGDDHELARGKDKEEWVSLLRNSARPVDSHSGRLAQSVFPSPSQTCINVSVGRLGILPTCVRLLLGVLFAPSKYLFTQHSCAI